MAKEIGSSHYRLHHAMCLLLLWDAADEVTCAWITLGIKQTDVGELACAVKGAVDNPYTKMCLVFGLVVVVFFFLYMPMFFFRSPTITSTLGIFHPAESYQF